jgi:hypothetical protein
MEGGIDSAHVSWLHSGELKTDPLHRATKGAQYQADKAPKFEIVESEGGLLIGARRNAEAGHYYWRVTQWIMPWYTMIPPYGDNALNGHAWTPIDDENCFAWTFTYHPARPLSDVEVGAMQGGHGIHVEFEPGTFRPKLNKDNDYGMDRAGQKAGITFSGVHGVAQQDASVQESMGPISDRTRENLCTTDNAIIMARHRLMPACAFAPLPCGALGLLRAAAGRAFPYGQVRSLGRAPRHGAYLHLKLRASPFLLQALAPHADHSRRRQFRYPQDRGARTAAARHRRRCGPAAHRDDRGLRQRLALLSEISEDQGRAGSGP